MSSETSSQIPTTKLRHLCEGCGAEEVLTPDEAYKKGWDYPPHMGKFGVYSPRTCPNCTIDKTLYWRWLQNGMEMPADLSEADIALLERVAAEPESILVDSG